MPDPIAVDVIPNQTIVQVTKPGTSGGTGGSLEDLSPSPAGSFAVPVNASFDAKGRCIGVSNGEDIGRESTQQNLRNAISTLQVDVTQLITTGLSGGIWNAS